MFDEINFIETEISHPLISRQVNIASIDKDKYDEENVRNSDFLISGSVLTFRSIPISQYALENLSYMQAFNIFTYLPGSYTRRKNYHSFLVLYTLEGIGEVEYLGRTYTLREGDGIFIDCRKPHYYKAQTKWKVCVFHSSGSLVSHYSEEYEKSARRVFHEETGGNFQNYLLNILTVYDSPSLYRDLRASHAIDSLFLYILTKTQNPLLQTHSVPRFVEIAMSYMESHFSSRITLDDLAELTNTNKYHLAKEFKRYTEFSPLDYLIWIRIREAKVMLKTTTMSANRIAKEVGIRDINNFNYHFKKRVGMTPGEYRTHGDYILQSHFFHSSNTNSSTF